MWSFCLHFYSANILLDRNFEAKVGDFGLAREMNPTSPADSYVKVSRVHGTRPYLPDEYLRSKKLSTKVDTFSFGTMLYEVTTGQRVYEESRPKKFLVSCEFGKIKILSRIFLGMPSLCPSFF